MAVLYGTLYLFFAAFPIVFREYRGWDETHTGLAFLGIGVGVILGVIYSFFDHAKYAKLRKTSDDELGPEARLPESLVGCIAIPISLFWFAWTITPSIHFMVPLVGSIPFGFGFVLVYISTQNYLVDAYTIYAASVLAANTLMRSTLGAAFPLFTHVCFAFMESLAAFSLVAGILQVLDVSFRAVKDCREIYKDGSVASNRDTEMMAEALGTSASSKKHPLCDGKVYKRWSANFRSIEDHVYDFAPEFSPINIFGDGYRHSPTPPSPGYTEVLDLSHNCAKIANELHVEIKKLKIHQRSRRQALLKTVSSIRKTRMLKEKRLKLEEHARTLDTVILIRLDTQSLRGSHQFNLLDDSVRDLALKLERGSKSTAQLLSNQTSQILDHFDRKFDDREGERRIDQACERFQASLFFPDIEAREDEIDEAVEGTCKWVFDPPTSAESNSKKWHNFREWLETGQNVYWINGKPGAGKSTLMKYIVDEPRTARYLSEWEPNTDLIIATFFFKNLGSELQKSTTGLLRSLIWQLIRHLPETIHLVLKRYIDATGQTQESPLLTMIPTWTNKRLLQILKDFANEKPATVTLCVFIDGLDEYVGDQDTLFHIISLLSSVGGCKVCVSSRPDQAFRSEFQGFPQCRVQDLNQRDIEKMVTAKLKPCLEDAKPTEIEAIKYLIEDLIYKAEGVFLWLSIMIKDLITASRHGDTISELHQRLKTTPNTINGLYRRILGRLDKIYLDYALKTFQIMVASERLISTHFRTLTLLEFACMDEASWTHVKQNDHPYFCSSIFYSRYRELNTRLNARCGNIIDIKDNVDETDKTVLTQPGRTVDFIHRSAVEFLKDEYVSKFSDKPCLTAAWIPLARARIGLVFLFPLRQPPITDYEAQVVRIRSTMDQEGPPDSPLGPEYYFGRLVDDAMVTVSFGENVGRNADFRKPLGDARTELTAQIFQTLHHLATTDDVIRTTDRKHYFMSQLVEGIVSTFVYSNNSGAPFPLQVRMQFAAFWGCESYIRSHLSAKTPIEEMEDILALVMKGIQPSNAYKVQGFPISFLNIIKLLIHQRRTFRNQSQTQSPLFEDANWTVNIPVLSGMDRCRASPWGAFLFQICHKAVLFSEEHRDCDFYGEREVWLQRCLELVEDFLSEGADHNARIGLQYKVIDVDDAHTLFLYMDMTPLDCVQAFVSQGRDYLFPIETILKSKGAESRCRYRFYRSEETYYRIENAQSKSLQRLLFSPPYAGFFVSDFRWFFLNDDGPLDILREIVYADDTVDKYAMENEWARGGDGWLEEKS
ncbi:MAG: hypothetical protein Q9192_003936 [Flavoplaca navasiana]